MIPVYIGLGANLEAPVEQLHNAVKALSTLVDCELKKVSAFYSSKPMGPQDQPDYVNAVALLNTRLAPEALLDELQRIELEQGRQRKDERWGPRTLDLDILLFGEQTINTKRLTVPHYGLCEREFVVYPLLEISPELKLPNGNTLADIAQQVPLNGLTPLELN
ncbi:2-amino-4-hydroxy-6-hydroxymethyldihydropteridine diphosphokinase [Pseudoalteromonas phenolica]|uniref:2-amino-4-hydroxy-6-hydroxymethyldihydropteridine pyrophosphokinase n=1 Tax=Pseudoalteromonas phenolica TaxID=161398 RepID=A0A0S2JYF1_9GAMM|nr:2-amino-4-hydroxy-6-hydroxymethyldihydropteridine diphosphokinase [Pseudoalteromonas phenolica]ALO41069.1 2-amino-4-hydroxy-6-hydroxymethyldihydropteridine pyrophosphokinase [Pseudoalteromonas phenolica]MBE0354406.1 2-amino-4-hydroxy-6-hydroxymethyldihydropteridine diphosphokinase [Pseudoalteromonas phenolica O-BC30]RXE94027.1 2-amino-4-hydroxy-6-hydroxymethyldihydropteridine diphosphokinase [Pseudoalteromonas phenolica O-BC30]